MREECNFLRNKYIEHAENEHGVKMWVILFKHQLLKAIYHRWLPDIVNMPIFINLSGNIFEFDKVHFYVISWFLDLPKIVLSSMRNVRVEFIIKK